MSQAYTQIEKCRICNNKNLVPLLNLGNQALTGVFPKNTAEEITVGPLELVKCHPKTESDSVCHLVQLNHSYNLDELYGDNYGYRSGLNPSMIKSLTKIVRHIEDTVELEKNDLVVDIGSNDATMLKLFNKSEELTLAGIDPTGEKFKEFYTDQIQLIPEFFSASSIQKRFPNQKAKVVTSIAMFYDLEAPLEFVREVTEILDDNGIWVLEQSYLPSMLRVNAYDTICHEHLEYYALEQINYLMEHAGMKVIDVELNDVNGGSFRITAAKKSSSYPINPNVANVLQQEKDLNLNSLTPYSEFHDRITQHKNELHELLNRLKENGEIVLGYGASTKGNVMLQYCNITPDLLPSIAEINEDKFGSFTPQTGIPIISETEAKSKNPDYFLVLPWHFKEGFLEKEQQFLNEGGKLIFPLPNIEIISIDD